MIEKHLDTKISCYESVRDKLGFSVSLREFLFEIPLKNLENINKLRASAAQRDQFKKQIPAATISGLFNERNTKGGLVHYNGLVCLDFDKKDNDVPADGIKQIFQSIKQTLVCSYSVSGEGVYAIIPTDNTDEKKHTQVTQFLINLLQKQYAITADKSCVDYSRLRFVSHDDDMYINESCTKFIISEKLQNKYTYATSAQRVEEAIKQLQAKNIDVTTDYSAWVQMAFALVNEFGADGEAYFHQISEGHAKYDVNETATKYQHCLKTSEGKVRLGTFFHLIKQYL